MGRVWCEEVSTEMESGYLEIFLVIVMVVIF